MTTQSFFRLARTWIAPAALALAAGAAAAALVVTARMGARPAWPVALAALAVLFAFASGAAVSARFAATRGAGGSSSLRREALELSRNLIDDYERRIHAIALDLHDDVAQRLYAVLSTLGSRNPAAEAPVREAMDRVKALSHELRPSQLHDEPLAASIERLCRGFAAAGGPAVSFKATGTERLEIPADARTQIHRIVHEALTNVVKHARARSVSVALVVSYPQLIVRIMDDGVGLPDDTRADAAHLGLRGMRERARLLEGELLVGGSRGSGTTVTALIPVVEYWSDKAYGSARR
jgi:signal transduction histidine kinase